MGRNNEALILSLLILTKETLDNLPIISSRDIYEQNSTIFKSDGLFSTSVFGEAGSVSRMESYGRINLGLTILHPRIYREICGVSSLYKGILTGTKYAIFDEKEKDFIESTIEDGHTGYNYFMKFYKDIDYTKKERVASRQVAIDFLNMYDKKSILINDYIVIPAGLRDYTVKENGKIFEDEINGFYRKLITISYTAKMFQEDNLDNEVVNIVKVRLQQAVNNVYEYIENILDGKGGYLQNKETKRTISYGTRNVIGSTPEMVLDYTDKTRPDAFTSIAGIYQTAKGLFPLTLYTLRSKYLHDVFDEESTKARLINPNTFKREVVNINEKSRSDWVTDDGIEKNINKFKQKVNLLSKIVISGYYLFLVYKKDDVVIVLKDIDELDDGLDKKMVTPITYIELFYLLLEPLMKEQYAYIVRYPIADKNSIIPTKVYLKSSITTNKVSVKILDSQEFRTVNEYPVSGETPYNNLNIPALYLDALGADFDGDKTSLNFLFNPISIEETKQQLRDITFLVGTDGNLTFSTGSIVNSALMKLMTS